MQQDDGGAEYVPTICCSHVDTELAFSSLVFSLPGKTEAEWTASELKVGVKVKYLSGEKNYELALLVFRWNSLQGSDGEAADDVRAVQETAD